MPATRARRQERHGSDYRQDKNDKAWAGRNPQTHMCSTDRAVAPRLQRPYRPPHRKRQQRWLGRAAAFPDHSLNRRPSVRSEEHTSELQSLMRISYAVFSLKKKTHTTTTA